MSGSDDDNLVPGPAQDPPASLQRQNERLQLLLNLTSRITSNLDLREVLRAISANFREVMRCDGAGVWLPGEGAGTFKLYAFDAPVSQAAGQIAIAIENALAYREISELTDKLAQEKLYLEEEIRSEMNFAEIVGKSSALRKVLKQVETVAPTDSTVLICGETGAGKELIARAIHDLSM